MKLKSFKYIFGLLIIFHALPILSDEKIDIWKNKNLQKDKDLDSIISKLGENSVGVVTTNLLYSVIEIEGERDRGEIKRFIERMPALDSRSLRKYMIDIQPGIVTDVKHSCGSCKDISTVRLPISSKFFFPD